MSEGRWEATAVGHKLLLPGHFADPVVIDDVEDWGEALQVLSNWADERFLADVTIYARSSEPLNVNEYETSVVMALEEEGVDVRDS